MAEYIKREAAIDAVNDLAGKAPTCSAYEAVWKAVRVLKKISAADVAPVVYVHPKGRYIVAECKGVRETFFPEEVLT